MRGLISLVLFLLLIGSGAAVYYIDFFALQELVLLIVLLPLAGMGLLKNFDGAFGRAELALIATSLGCAFTALFEWVAASAGLDGSLTVVSIIAIGFIGAPELL